MADSTQETQDIQNNIFEAISTIVQSELANSNYDKTIVATVTDASEAASGIYTVSDGSVEFKAVSSDETYKENDLVLVSIQLGDMTLEKTILRKYQDSEAQAPITYVAPLELFVLYSENLIPKGVTSADEVTWTAANENTEFSILANGPITSKRVWEINLDDSNLNQPLLQHSEQFTTVGIAAMIETRLGADTYEIRSGLYGLRIDLDYYQTALNNKKGTVSFLIDSQQDMTGNVYQYSVGFQLEKMYNIASLGHISTIRISIYQTGDFLYFNPDTGTFLELPFSSTIGAEDLTSVEYFDDNIIFSNIKLFFGYDVNSFEDDTLSIFCPDSLDYRKEDLNRDIYLLWLNKTEDNEFLGFSDGILDKSYNEEVYLEKNTRLTDAMNLLSDDTAAVAPMLEALELHGNGITAAKAIDSLWLDVFDKVKNPNATLNFLELFKSLLQRGKDLDLEKSLAAKLDTAFNDAEANKDSIITPLYNAIKTILPDLGNNIHISFYNALSLLILNDYMAQSASTTYNVDLMISDYNKVCAEIGNLIQNIDAIFNQILGLLDYASVYDTYYDTWVKQHKANLEYYRNLFLSYYPTVLEDIVNAVNQKFANSNFITVDEEYVNFLMANAERYALYWFRYNKDASDVLGGIGWERLSTQTGTLVGNGLPSSASADGYYSMYPSLADNHIHVILATGKDKIEDRFKALLYYNHVPHESNELVFSNQDALEALEAANLSKALLINHYSKSQELYQLYDEFNTLLDYRDSLTTRTVEATYIDLTTNEVNYSRLSRAHIYWYLPKSQTMLMQGKNDLNNLYALEPEYSEGVVVNQELCNRFYEPYKDKYYIQTRQLSEYNATTLNFNTQLRFSYQISSLYSPENTDNTIMCIVDDGDYEYKATINFNFSTYGNSGTEYTLSIVPSDKDLNAVELIEQTGKDTILTPLHLHAELRDASNNNVENFGLISVRWFPDEAISANNKLSFRCSESNNTSINYFPANFIIGESAGLKNISLSEIRNCLNILKLSVAVINEDRTNSTVLTSYYPIPLTSNKNYYLNGPTTITYKASGETRADYTNMPYTFWERDPKSANNKELKYGTDIDYEIVYLGHDGNNSENNYVRVDVNAVPKLKETHPLLRIDEKSNLVYLKPPAFFVDEADTDFLAILVVKDIKNGVVLYAQPILMTQNRWGNPTLNDWNGDLTIDEEGNKILSAMVGAGYKESDNSFSGVIMGAVGLESNSSLVTTGLFGYSAGALTFGFNKNGTAFIGPSGSGRIEFNVETTMGINGVTKKYYAGVIKSAGYNKTSGSGSGMSIWLDGDEDSAAKIHMKGLGSALVLIQTPVINKTTKDENGIVTYSYTDDEKLPYFLITDRLGLNLIFISATLPNKDEDTGYYLLTSGFVKHTEDLGKVTKEGAGTKIDLGNGAFTSYNLDLIGLLSNGDLYNKIRINSVDSKYPLTIGRYDSPYFKVAWDGGVQITNTDNQYGTVFGITKGTDNLYHLVINTEEFTLNNGKITITTDNFSIDQSGNATFGGILNAPVGLLGGWTITKDKIYNFDSNGYGTFLKVSGGYRLVIGFPLDQWDAEGLTSKTGSYGIATFRVANSGAFKAGNNDLYVQLKEESDGNFKLVINTPTLKINTSSSLTSSLFIENPDKTFSINNGKFTINLGNDVGNLKNGDFILQLPNKSEISYKNFKLLTENDLFMIGKTAFSINAPGVKTNEPLFAIAQNLMVKDGKYHLIINTTNFKVSPEGFNIDTTTADGGVNITQSLFSIDAKNGDKHLFHLYKSGKKYLLTIDTDNFTLNEDGDATFSGELKAPKGTIGGFTITSTRITSSDNSVFVKSSTGVAFAAGATYTSDGSTNTSDSNDGTAFWVSHSGNLYARNATIRGTIYATNGEFTGKITASSGKIAGFTINGDALIGENTGYKIYMRPPLTNAANGCIYIEDKNYGQSGHDVHYPFRLNGDGSGVFTGTIYASAGEFTGQVITKSGEIGGWVIGTNSLYQEKTINIDGVSTDVKVTFANYNSEVPGSRFLHCAMKKHSTTDFANSDDYLRLYRNGNIWTKGNIIVEDGGSVKILDGGSIIADNGNIGNWDIKSTSLIQEREIYDDKNKHTHDVRVIFANYKTNSLTSRFLHCLVKTDFDRDFLDSDDTFKIQRNGDIWTKGNITVADGGNLSVSGYIKCTGLNFNDKDYTLKTGTMVSEVTTRTLDFYSKGALGSPYVQIGDDKYYVVGLSLHTGVKVIKDINTYSVAYLG